MPDASWSHAYAGVSTDTRALKERRGVRRAEGRAVRRARLPQRRAPGRRGRRGRPAPHAALAGVRLVRGGRHARGAGPARPPPPRRVRRSRGRDHRHDGQDQHQGVGGRGARRQAPRAQVRPEPQQPRGRAAHAAGDRRSRRRSRWSSAAPACPARSRGCATSSGPTSPWSPPWPKGTSRGSAAWTACSTRRRRCSRARRPRWWAPRRPRLADAARHAAKRVVTAGVEPRGEWAADDLTLLPDGRPRFTVRGVAVELPLRGRHMVANALVALAVADASACRSPTRRAGCRRRGCRPAAPRCWTLDGMTVVNDCYNANPSSFGAALDLAGRDARRAAGGRGRGHDARAGRRLARPASRGGRAASWPRSPPWSRPSANSSRRSRR